MATFFSLKRLASIILSGLKVSGLKLKGRPLGTGQAAEVYNRLELLRFPELSALRRSSIATCTEHSRLEYRTSTGRLSVCVDSSGFHSHRPRIKLLGNYATPQRGMSL